MNILILGVGALGSNLTARLSSDLKNHKITILDKDIVEERNIIAGTQFYSNDLIDVPKVEALQYLISRMYNKDIDIINQEITINNADKILAPFTNGLIIDCFDNHSARLAVHGRVVARHINALHIGFSKDFTYAIEWSPHYKPPTDIMANFDICETQGASAFVNMVSSIAAITVEEFILNNKKINIVGNKFKNTIIS